MGKKERPRMPRRFVEITSRVSERDREWFEKHPGEEQYFRPYIPGEFGPEGPSQDSLTLVIQIEPGVRIRKAVPL